MEITHTASDSRPLDASHPLAAPNVLRVATGSVACFWPNPNPSTIVGLNADPKPEPLTRLSVTALVQLQKLTYMKITESKLLTRYKKALAQTRENYAALLKDYRRMVKRNTNQAHTIYRFQELARRMTEGDLR